MPGFLTCGPKQRIREDALTLSPGSRGPTNESTDLHPQKPCYIQTLAWDILQTDCD